VHATVVETFGSASGLQRFVPGHTTPAEETLHVESRR
jgi:hypothetical protein